MRWLPYFSPADSGLAAKSQSLLATHGIVGSSIPYLALDRSRTSQACDSSRLTTSKLPPAAGSAPAGNRRYPS
jgi:hypothetical protein